MAFHQQFRRVDIFFNEKEDDSSEDDARTTTARAKAFPLLLLLLDVAAPFRDTIEDVFLQNANDYDLIEALSREQRGVALFAEGAEFAEAREDGFANVNDIVVLFFFFFVVVVLRVR